MPDSSTQSDNDDCDSDKDYSKHDLKSFNKTVAFPSTYKANSTSSNEYPFGTVKHRRKRGPKSKVKIKTLTIDGQLVYFCKICDKIFTRRKDKLNHELAHNGESVYKCTECGKEYLHESSLASHMRTHAGDNLHLCELCPKMFSQSNHLKNHLLTHSEPTDFTCKTCYMEFSSGPDLKKHLRSEIEKERIQYWCTLCNLYLCRIHGLIVDRKELHAHICSACNEMFMTNKKLKIHMRKYAHYSRPKQDYIEDLKEHELYRLYPYKHVDHDNQEGKKYRGMDTGQYITNQISKMENNPDIYLKKSDFKEIDLKSPHKQRKGKPYCKKCDRSYKDSTSLYLHKIQVHGENYIDEKPVLYGHKPQIVGHHYKCNKCDEEFPSKQELLNHFSQQHTEIFQCHICNKTFKLGDKLTEHICLHSDAKCFQCYICRKSFDTKINLNQHLQFHVRKGIQLDLNNFVCDKADTACEEFDSKICESKSNCLSEICSNILDSYDVISPQQLDLSSRLFIKREYDYENTSSDCDNFSTKRSTPCKADIYEFSSDDESSFKSTMKKEGNKLYKRLKNSKQALKFYDFESIPRVDDSNGDRNKGCDSKDITTELRVEINGVYSEVDGTMTLFVNASEMKPSFSPPPCPSLERDIHQTNSFDSIDKCSHENTSVDLDKKDYSNGLVFDLDIDTMELDLPTPDPSISDNECDKSKKASSSESIDLDKKENKVNINTLDSFSTKKYLESSPLKEKSHILNSKSSEKVISQEKLKSENFKNNETSNKVIKISESSKLVYVGSYRYPPAISKSVPLKQVVSDSSLTMSRTSLKASKKKDYSKVNNLQATNTKTYFPIKNSEISPRSKGALNLPGVSVSTNYSNNIKPATNVTFEKPKAKRQDFMFPEKKLIKSECRIINFDSTSKPYQSQADIKPDVSALHVPKEVKTELCLSRPFESDLHKRRENTVFENHQLSKVQTDINNTVAFSSDTHMPVKVESSRSSLSNLPQPNFPPSSSSGLTIDSSLSHSSLSQPSSYCPTLTSNSLTCHSRYPLQPQSTTLQPQSTLQPTTLQPQSTTYQPKSSTYQPTSTKLQPQSTKLQPQSTTLQKQASTLQPQSTMLKPQAATLKPQSTTYQPKSSTYQPASTKLQPQSTTLQQQASTLQPQSTTLKPQAATLKPQSTTIQPQFMLQTQATTLQPQATTLQSQSTTFDTKDPVLRNMNMMDLINQGQNTSKPNHSNNPSEPFVRSLSSIKETMTSTQILNAPPTIFNNIGYQHNCDITKQLSYDQHMKADPFALQNQGNFISSNVSPIQSMYQSGYGQILPASSDLRTMSFVGQDANLGHLQNHNPVGFPNNVLSLKPPVNSFSFNPATIPRFEINCLSSPVPNTLRVFQANPGFDLTHPVQHYNQQVNLAVPSMNPFSNQLGLQAPGNPTFIPLNMQTFPRF